MIVKRLVEYALILAEAGATGVALKVGPVSLSVSFEGMAGEGGDAVGFQLDLPADDEDAEPSDKKRNRKLGF